MSHAVCCDCGRLFYQDAHWKIRCYRCWRLQTGREEAAPIDTTTRELRHAGEELAERLPRLIQLCHPDKHGGSDAATRMTQWLLDVRRRLNGQS